MKKKVFNHIIKICLVSITTALLIQNIYASPIMHLEDKTVVGKSNEYQQDSNYLINELKEEEKQSESEKRESFIFSSKEKTPVDEILNEGFKEVVSSRKENVKTFEKGEIQKTIIYGKPIHFKKDNQYIDYNNNLKKSKSRTLSFYQNTLGDHSYEIPEVLEDKSNISIDDLDINIKNITKTTGQVKEDTILYKNAEEEKDYSITCTNQGITIMSAVSDMNVSLTQSYQLQLSKDMTVKENKSNDTVHIYQNNKLSYVMTATEIKDADGNVIELQENNISLTDNQVTITPNEQQLKQLTTAPYSMEVAIENVTTPDNSLIKMFGVRSGPKFEDKSYAPEVNPNFTYFAQIGRDPTGSINNGASSPENVGLVKIDFDRLVDEYIGEQRRIESASISMRLATAITNTSTLSISRLAEKMPLFDSYANLKWTKYEPYFNKYKDRGQSTSPVRLDTKTFTRVLKTKQFIHFDITDAIDYWYQGNPAYGLLIEGDSADTTAQAIYNHSTENTSSRLPYLTVTHVQDGPIDPSLSLDSTTVNLRPFTQSNGNGLLQFSALGFDGLTRPNSKVQIQVVDTTNNAVVYDQTATGSSTYRIFPLYDNITNAQKYYRKTSNYQMPKLLLSSSLTPNHLYQVKYKVTAYDKDGKVTGTKDWTNSETFQTYKVSSFDRVTRIMSFYNVSNTSQFRLDNNMLDSLLVQGNLLFIRNPRANQNKAYSSTSLTVNDKKAIDMALMGRGLHCEYGYEPINYNTGNLYYNNQDAYFMEYGEKYYFERSYNSLSETKGAFGNNWDLNWNYQLSMLENAILFSDGTGKILTFFKDGSGNYQKPAGYDISFRKEKISEKTVYVDSDYYDEEEAPIQKPITYPIYDYIITDNENHKAYRFNDEGYIKEVTLDTYGHKMMYTYNSEYRIQQMKTSSGKTFTFTYNNDGLVTSIALPNGTSIQYGYDSEGNMISFTDQKNYQIKYTYQGKGLLKTYTSRQNNNVILTNVFDSSRRVIKQTDAKNQTVTLDYQNDYTKITDYQGKTQYIYLDNQKRTTKIVNQDGSQESNTYDSQNHLLSIIEDNLKTEFVYNSNGQLINEIRSDGKKLTYTYSGNNVVKKTDFDNKTTSYEYDSYGHITKTIYHDQTYTANKYNTDGQLIYEKDIYGLEKTYTYSQGNKVKETDQNGYEIQYTYDALGMLNTITDQEGYKTEYIRDQRGQKIKEVLPIGTKYYTYDGDGNLIYEEDSNGNGITYVYDELSRVIEKKDAYGATKTTYDVNGNILKTTDELGYTKKYTYDSVGNKTSETNENGDTLYYKYDINKRLIETKDINGIITYHSYDSLGQLIKEQRLDKVLKYVYNEQGKIIEKDENGIITKYRYDDFGNIIYKETRGIKEEYKYNHERLVSQAVSGVKTEYKYDEYGHKISEKDELGNETKYQYSPSGNLIKVTQPNKSTLTFTYDGNHRLLTTKDSLGNIKSSVYDANGNVVSATDENGNVTKYTYTARNQMKSMTDPKGNVYTYKYDAKGQLIETTNPLMGIQTNTYSPTGLLLIKKDELNQTTESIYDKVGRVIETRDVKDRKALTLYDDYGRIIETEDVYGKKTKYTYNEYDELIKTEHDDGYIKEMTYDEHGLLESEVNEKKQKVSYEYDEYGRVIKTIDIRGNETTQVYDQLGRIISTKDKRNEKIYEYDCNGNLLTKQVNGAKTTYKYDQLGRILKETDALDRTEEYTYDKGSQIIEIKDAKGYITKHTYDANNNLITTTNPKNQKITYEYDELNRVVKQINPDLTFKVNEYDQLGRVIKSINELGYAQEVTYNELNQEVQTKNALGHIVEYKYNDQDLLSKTIYPDETTLLNEYDEKNQLVKALDAKGNSYEYEYDEYGHKVKEIAPNGYYKEYTFDEYDKVKTLSDNDGLLLTYEYNEFGDVISTSNSLEQKSSSVYDEYGRVIETIDIQGNKSKTSYDILNRVKESIDIRGNKTSYVYNELDQVIETNNNDKITKQEYDEIGNVIKDIDALGNQTLYEYDINNRLIKTIDALDNETTYTYDNVGQMLTKVDAKKQVITYGYDEIGNKTKEINPQGIEKLYHYDSMNQMISMQTEDEKVIDYEYDDYGNMSKVLLKDKVKYEFIYNENNQLIEQRDALNHKETYTYYLNGNENNQLIEQRDALNHKETYTYYLNGNVESYTNKNDITTYYEYNRNNQLTHMYTDNIETNYEYNEYNQLIKASREDKTSLFNYDQYGLLTEVTDPNKQTVKYEYDQEGRKTKVIYPSQKTVSYEYNHNNQITKVNDGKQETEYTYDKLGRQILSKNPVQEKVSQYDEIGQLINSQTKMNNQEVIYDYEYDELGNTVKETSIIDKDKTIKEMKYDKVGQLLESEYTINEDKLTRKYTYDESGNRILYEEDHNGNKIEKHSRYNANDEVLNIDKSVYTYDDSGNIIEKTNEYGHSEKLQYNDYDELIKIESSLGKTIEYEYDALGNRISKEEDIAIQDKDILNHLKADVRIPNLEDIEDIDKALEKKMEEYEEVLSSNKLGKQKETWFKEDGIHLTTKYVNDISYENVQVLEQIQEKGTETYTYGNERISLSYKDENYNYIYDGKYNVIGEDGTLDNVYRYDDFGNIIQNINDGYGYSSESTEYKYQYLRARYYETSEGRFLQRDNYLGKRNTSDYNQYIYGLNNPQMYKDPSGHFVYDVLKAVNKMTKEYAKKAIDSYSGIVNNALDMAAGILKPFGYDKPIQVVKKTVNKEIPKIKETVDIVSKALDMQISTAKKQAQIRADFQDYAAKNGLEAAYSKYKNVDSLLLESMVQAYCDKLGLDYISINKALSSVAKVEQKTSLATKYTIICESIKGSPTVNEAAVKSSVGYSQEELINTIYLSAAIKTLYEARSLSMYGSNPLNTLSYVINNINVGGTTANLKNEYVSNITSHCKDMYSYITGGEGKYKAIDIWYGTGNDTSGEYRTEYLHIDGEAYSIYNSWLYKNGVAVSSWVQGNQLLFNVVSTGFTALAMKGYQKISGAYSKGASGAKVDNFIQNNVNPNFQKSVKKAFTSDAKVTVLTEDKIVYRYHGGDSSAKSYWYTPKKTTSPGADLALPKGNTYTQVDKLVIPKGTEVLEGTVAPNFGQPGGGYQIYVPDPSVVRKY